MGSQRRSCFRVLLLAAIYAAAATCVLFVLGEEWWVTKLASRLERRFRPFTFDQEQQLSGIIALGGGVERFEAAVELAKRFPRAKLLLIAGRETEVARTYATNSGIPAEQLMVEARSANTYENAQASAALLNPRPGEQWLLVTSASHMPRAVGTFRKAGFEVLPSPVFHPIRPGDAARTVVHEWVGLIGYWFLGRTDAIFPGPSQGTTRDYARSVQAGRDDGRALRPGQAIQPASLPSAPPAHSARADHPRHPP